MGDYKGLSNEDAVAVTVQVLKDAAAYIESSDPVNTTSIKVFRRASESIKVDDLGPES